MPSHVLHRFNTVASTLLREMCTLQLEGKVLILLYWFHLDRIIFSSQLKFMLSSFVINKPFGINFKHIKPAGTTRSSWCIVTSGWCSGFFILLSFLIYIFGSVLFSFLFFILFLFLLFVSFLFMVFFPLSFSVLVLVFFTVLFPFFLPVFIFVFTPFLFFFTFLFSVSLFFPFLFSIFFFRSFLFFDFFSSVFSLVPLKTKINSQLK